VFNVAYTKGVPVYAGDRHISADPILGLGASQYSSIGNHGVIYDSEFGFLGLNEGGDPRNINDYHPYNKPEDGWNFAPQNYLLTPTERKSVFVQGRYDITDNIRFRTDVLYNQRLSDQQLAGIPIGVGELCSTTFGCTYTMSADSYYNPVGNQALGEGNGRDLGGFCRRLTER